MKKFYMTIVAMLCGVAAMAQGENTLYIENIKVKAGDETTIPVCLKNADEVVRIQVRFDKSELLKQADDSYLIFIGDDEDEYEMNAERLDLDAARLANKKPTGKLEKMFKFEWAGDWLMFSCAAGGYVDDGGVFHNVPFVGNDGVLFEMPLTIDASVPDGVYTVNFDQKLVSAVSDPYESPTDLASSPTGSFTITVGEITAINNINADDSNAPIYNVAGQRVSKAQKGVYIQNGKKVAVK
jgi:hypothetical protein